MAVPGRKSKGSHLLVAAFDFGTTYSGYAFSFLNDPLKIVTNQSWIAGSEKLISLKTPTCVLLKPNKEFHSFGFEAENKYADLAEDDEHHGWLLFRRFKMKLHNTDGLSRHTTIEDINGTSMPAMKIFSMSLRFLREHFLDALGKQTCGVLEKDVQYVITLPAIWNDSAKQFMREAAIQSGMESSRIKLALEPEAASIWCQQVTTQAKQVLTGTGSKYMVIDLGGGTADISVHEKLCNGQLKELHKASGGPWGGSYVDKNYIKCVTDIFGTESIEKFKLEQMADFFDIQREFETKKRGIKGDTEGKITFKISASLKEIYNESEKESLTDKLSSLGLSGKMSVTGDKLRVDNSIVKSWFDGPVNSMIGHVKGILAEPKMKDVKLMLLVGGFGESHYVQDRMKNEFGSKHVIIPEEAGLGVLKGA
ncbi:heat shock 70 kDa protein 12B-like [Mercenaria mercenaria]|uniref:heat shock 70 kDa protein 12B-like n=1 Tax=Mercenaria mercenaria TaxID=6596 RepID=UPI00234F53A1|nr:heat shock 70 kDa protein 12B-like [Mercenaria mercenaria]